MKNKRGIFGFVEIVSIILAIVFLVFAIYFMSSQMGKGERSFANYASARISESVKDGLRIDLVDKDFAVSQTIFSVMPGESYNFFVGVKGIGNFSLNVDSDWFFYNKNIVSLDNKIEFFPIMLNIPNNVNGSFDFKLSVFKNDVFFDSVQLLVSVEDVKKE